MNGGGRRCLSQSLRHWPSWSTTAATPTRTIWFFGTDDVRKKLSTEASGGESAIDAHVFLDLLDLPYFRPDCILSLIGFDNITYASRPPKSVYVSLPASSFRRQQRVSQMVILLQTKMRELISAGEYGKAIEIFENFVNSGFKQAAEENLPNGQLPMGRRPAEFQWRLYIHALYKKQRDPTAGIASAIALMKQIGIQPKSAHYVPLLESIRQTGDKAAAIKTVDEMTRNGVVVTTICYEHAIFTCLMTRDVRSATVLLDRLFRSSSAYHAYRTYDRWKLYMRVIQFCASLKRIETAMAFLRQMTELDLLIPIHVYLDVAIHAADVDDTAAVDTMLSHVQNALQVFRMGQKKRVLIPVPVSEGILLALLNSAARTGSSFLAERAWTMLSESLSIEQAKAEIRKNSAMTSTGDDEPEKREESKGQSEKESELQEEFISEEDLTGSDPSEEDKAVEGEHQAEQDDFVQRDIDGLEDDWRTVLAPFLQGGRRPMAESYHAFIEAQAKAGNIDSAFEMALELEQTHPENPADFSPTQGFCPLVDEIGKNSTSVDQAYLVLDRWYKEGKKVTAVLLDVIVRACARMGDANRAFETFETYPRLGLRHRTESYNSLMEVCAEQRQVEAIMQLLAKMVKNGIKPNVDTYMQIIEGYINNGDTNGISHALSITRREGHTPTVRILERALECATQYRDEKTRLLVRRELMAAGHFSEVTFDSGRNQWQDRGRGFGGRGRRRGRGRSPFSGRQSPYAHNDDPRYTSADTNQRDTSNRSTLAYVGSRSSGALQQPNETQTMPDQALEPLDATAALPDSVAVAVSTKSG